MNRRMVDRRANYYHAHIYFEASTQESAEALRSALLRDLPPSVRVSRLVDRPIGPHPVPMFELDFSLEDYPAVRAHLESNRGAHTVLIHPVTEDEVWNHTEGAEWLGPPVDLNIQFLRDFMAGTTPGVSQTIPFA